MLTLLRTDRGMTIIESSVAVIILGVLLGAIYSIVIRVNRDAGDQVAIANTESTLREAAHGIDVELRQATADTDNGSPIQYLAWDEIQFLSYLNGGSDLHLFRYRLQGTCATGCDLEKALFAPIPSSDPPAYQSSPLFTEVQVSGILASTADPVFVGQEWVSGSLSPISNCDESSSPDCDFNLVEINLRADPNALGTDVEVVITEPVMVRNVR